MHRNTRQKQQQHQHQQGRPAGAKRAVGSLRWKRPPWDPTVHDLDSHKLSDAEVQRRKDIHKSPHMGNIEAIMAEQKRRRAHILRMQRQAEQGQRGNDAIEDEPLPPKGILAAKFVANLETTAAPEAIPSPATGQPFSRRPFAQRHRFEHKRPDRELTNSDSDDNETADAVPRQPHPALQRSGHDTLDLARFKALVRDQEQRDSQEQLTDRPNLEDDFMFGPSSRQRGGQVPSAADDDNADDALLWSELQHPDDDSTAQQGSGDVSIAERLHTSLERARKWAQDQDHDEPPHTADTVKSRPQHKAEQRSPLGTPARQHQAKPTTKAPPKASPADHVAVARAELTRLTSKVQQLQRQVELYESQVEAGGQSATANADHDASPRADDEEEAINEGFSRQAQALMSLVSRLTEHLEQSDRSRKRVEEENRALQGKVADQQAEISALQTKLRLIEDRLSDLESRARNQADMTSPSRPGHSHAGQPQQQQVGTVAASLASAAPPAAWPGTSAPFLLPSNSSASVQQQSNFGGAAGYASAGGQYGYNANRAALASERERILSRARLLISQHQHHRLAPSSVSVSEPVVVSQQQHPLPSSQQQAMLHHVQQHLAASQQQQQQQQQQQLHHNQQQQQQQQYQPDFGTSTSVLGASSTSFAASTSAYAPATPIHSSTAVHVPDTSSGVSPLQDAVRSAAATTGMTPQQLLGSNGAASRLQVQGPDVLSGVLARLQALKQESNL